MECNKDEAAKAKEIAEQKLTEKDIAGAQKFALKAQNMFPGLDGLSQFLEVVNIYVAHEKKTNGDVDFYGVLSVEPSADDETIRKHYRRLAVALHPDKNQSVGADGAFKIVSEAWSLLSDRTKRVMYDNKHASMQGNPHGFQNFSMNPAIARNSPTTKKIEANGAQHYATTAWQSAHPGRSAGGNLKRAHEEAAMSSLNQEALLKKSNSLMKTDAGFVPDSVSTYAKTDRLIKKRLIAESNSKFQRKGMVNEVVAKGGSSSQGNIHGNENDVLRAERVAVVGSNKPTSSRELSNSEILNMLAKKARSEISKKLKEWRTTAASRASSQKEKEVEKKKQTAPEVIKNDLRRDKVTHDAVVDSKILREQKKSPVFGAPVDLKPEAKSITVPDSDFHNFDKDRTEKSFDDNQVWAAYDTDDSMPRYYALIHNVISKKPFEVKFSWLNSKNNSELGPINWVGSGFLKTSGDFRIGKHDINKMLNSFSHKVKWVKGARGVIQIFPRKGDVWALYRHWSPKWNMLTPNDMVHNYEMVEVCGDYTEKEGVTVVPLVKVAGFVSVFHQHLNPKYLRHIPREEMFRFSHQVPSYLLTGQEAPNAPTGCWELDPAALPLELLRVMTDDEIEAQGKIAVTSNLERTCESKEKEKFSVVGSSNVTKGKEANRDSNGVVKPIVTYSRRNKEKKTANRESNGVVKQPIVTYSRRNKEKKAKASTIEAKRETSSVAAEGF